MNKRMFDGSRCLRLCDVEMSTVHAFQGHLQASSGQAGKDVYMR